MATDTRNRSWTVLELLNWTVEHFRAAGVKNPRLNAELLLGRAMGLERIMLYARFDVEVKPEQRQLFREMVRRRAAREPLQYVLGEWEFCGRPFSVTPAVMVPRQETEVVVQCCLQAMTGDGSGLWAADVCTGSGVIAVTLAAERPGLHVIATDTSSEALDVARANAERHGVAGRVHFVQGDLAEPIGSQLPSGRAGVDLFVANPPYVPTGDIAGLEPEVRDHEPRQALDGGADGLHVIRRLVPEAARWINPGGRLVLEVGVGQARAVAGMIHDAGAFEKAIETSSDPGGCKRAVCATKRAS